MSAQNRIHCFLSDEQRQRIEMWVQALRSGQYIQGFNRLTTVYPDLSTRHCCLGVATELYRKAHVLPYYDELIDPQLGVSERVYTPVNGFASETSFLPAHVAEWYGLTIDPVTFISHHSVYVKELLTRLNDQDRTFDEIAQAIEYTYLENTEDSE